MKLLQNMVADPGSPPHHAVLVLAQLFSREFAILLCTHMGFLSQLSEIS